MARGNKSPISKIFVWIILILLMIGLVGFGATGLSGTVRSIGKVGDTPIDVNRYARSLEQELRALSAQTGQQMSLSQARQFGVDQVVLQRLIATAALEDEASKIGISVGDEEVRRQVVNTPAFRGLDGQFDRDAYDFTLERSGMNATEFEDSVRADVSSTLLQTAVAGGVVASPVFAETLINYIGERRNFSWIELNRRSLQTALEEPSDETLRAHYTENQDKFMLPETKEITYVWLSPDFIIDQVVVDETALEALYQDRIEEYVVPERRLVERLIFGTNEEAEQALTDIAAGTTTFEALVQERGLELSDIDLGDVTRDSLDAAGADVFALTGPGIAGPVETDLGPALMRVNAILAARETSFEEARESLLDEFAADSARRDIANRIDDIDDLLAGGATLEELADETDMRLAQISWSSQSDEDIAAYSDFAQAARDVTLDDYPEVLELDDGGIFALRLNEIVAPRPEPFDDAVVRVIQDWETNEVEKQLTEQAQTMVAEIENGASIGSLGHPVTVETHVTRDEFIEGTAEDFLTQVFEMEVGDVRAVSGPEIVQVVQLSEVVPADTENDEADTLRSQLNDSVAQAVSQDILDAYTRAVQAQAGISLNQQAITAVHSQFP